jgi:hypothetical protein
MKRYLLFALAIGCTTSDPNATEDPVESQTVSAITACPVGQWCQEAPPINAVTTAAPLLHGIFAISAGDVFAVGDGGTILRRINGGWTVMSSGTTADLRGVWGSSSSDVWASGVAGTILHFNGTAWSAVSGATSDVDAVWGSAPDDVWFAGGGTVLHWTGAGFTSFGFGGTMLAVSGTGPRDVWVTGENTNLHHFNGSTWTTVNPGAGTSTLFTVLALSASDVWTTDFMSGKETMHWNGSKWVAIRTGGGIFNGMAAVTASDIWGVGGSRVGHWNGTAWTLEQPFGSNASMWSVSTTAGNLWLVGDGALIAHRTF